MTAGPRLDNGAKTWTPDQDYPLALPAPTTTSLSCVARSRINSGVCGRALDPEDDQVAVVYVSGRIAAHSSAPRHARRTLAATTPASSPAWTPHGALAHRETPGRTRRTVIPRPKGGTGPVDGGRCFRLAVRSHHLYNRRQTCSSRSGDKARAGRRSPPTGRATTRDHGFHGDESRSTRPTCGVLRRPISWPIAESRGHGAQACAWRFPATA